MKARGGERTDAAEESWTGRRITRRKLLAVAAAGIGVGTLNSCSLVRVRQPEIKGSGTERKGPIKLAVVPKALGFDFWEKVRLGAECAASKHDEVTIQWDGTTAETDIIGQVNLLTNYITQGVDGLVYAATDARVLSQVTQLALDHGIVVVNIDSGTDPQPEEVPLFATDNVTAARKVAGLISGELKEKGKEGGKLAFIPFQPGTSTNDQRATGFRQGLEEHPNLDLVAQQSSESDYVTGLQVTENIMSAYPDLDGIFAANEPGVLGAAEAMYSLDTAGEVVIAGWDASPAEVAALRDGVVKALVVQNPFQMGYRGVNAAVETIRTGKRVESEPTGTTYVTKENLDDPEVQAVINPSCKTT
jgi:ribose transport system substrate-binding protein